MYKKLPFVILSFSCFYSGIAQKINTQPINGAPQNIVVILANGIGMTHLQATALKKGSPISLSKFPVMGFSEPWPANGKMPTDSTLSIAMGTNRFEDSDPKIKAETLFSLAKDKQMSTGIIVTGPVTETITKNFVFYNTNKKDNEVLAADYLNSNLNIIIGGGSQYFDKRYDGRNLFKEFRAKGYNTVTRLSGLSSPTSTKTIALLEKDGIYRASARKDFLSKSSLFAMHSLLGSGGSFILINDTKIEEADSLNNTPFLMEELMDLDKLITDLTEQSGGSTLILVIGNYERGGLELNSTKISPNGEPDILWRTKKITSNLAPVFATGPGSEKFSGFYSPEDIYLKLSALINSRR